MFCRSVAAGDEVFDEWRFSGVAAVADDAIRSAPSMAPMILAGRSAEIVGMPTRSVAAVATPASVRRASVNAAMAIATSRTAMSKYLPVVTRLTAMQASQAAAT